ncbi:hypothetical protein Taro_046299 [Colocasia esculenta]|uniref:Uncoupling protein 3 n=1 Tax=Colocasia esculenta TaxID=4460 RepID=A0A843WPH5_COLES|nr:hypothetical protein [Colocasia esculenta]
MASEECEWVAARGGGGKREAFTKVALTSLSAAVAEAATFPIDAVKTRLQLQGELQMFPHHRAAAHGATSAPTNFLPVGLGVLEKEKGGILGIYRGLAPAVLRHLFYTPIRIVGYEHLRDNIGSGGESFLCLSANNRKNAEIAIELQVVASPADLVKVRMQADGHPLRQRLPPRYTGIVDAFTKIIRTEGAQGLWRGVIPNTQRAFLVNMGELACYDQAKRFIVNNKICGDNTYAHILASIASGLSATTLSCPDDVVKTRMMNQVGGKGTKTMYMNSCDCLVKTVKYEGIMALWKGFFPTWARLGPCQFVFWVSYEKLRQAAGLSSF